MREGSDKADSAGRRRRRFDGVSERLRDQIVPERGAAHSNPSTTDYGKIRPV